MPDVVGIGSAELAALAQKGIIREIDSYMKSWDGIKDSAPGALENVKINGRYYAVPYRLDVRTLAYNMTFFDEAGLDRRSPPKTWEELRSYAKKLTKYDQNGNITVQGYDVQSHLTKQVLPFILQAGGHYLSADGSTTLIDSAEAIEAVTFLHELIYLNRVSTTKDGNIRTGNVAMQHNSTAFMKQASDYEIGVADPTRHRRQATQMLVNKFGISSACKHPDLAWEWIKFMMERENIRLLVAESREISGRVSTLFMSPYSEDKRYEAFFRAAMIAEAVPDNLVSDLASVHNRIQKALQDIFNNVSPIRSTLEQAAYDINNNILKLK